MTQKDEKEFSFWEAKLIQEISISAKFFLGKKYQIFLLSM